jgi:hypothetical protein
MVNQSGYPLHGFHDVPPELPGRKPLSRKGWYSTDLSARFFNIRHHIYLSSANTFATFLFMRLALISKRHVNGRVPNGKSECIILLCTTDPTSAAPGLGILSAAPRWTSAPTGD